MAADWRQRVETDSVLEGSLRRRVPSGGTGGVCRARLGDREGKGETLPWHLSAADWRWRLQQHALECVARSLCSQGDHGEAGCVPH